MSGGAEATAKFLAGLLGGVNSRRAELHAEDRQNEERERASLLHILDAASQSPTFDPNAYPKLVSMMMEAQGADKKEIAGIKSAFQSLLGQGYETTGTKITGYDTRPATDNTGAEAPYVADPGDAPLAEFGAKIRKPVFMSPEQVANREAYATGQKIRATREAEEPFKVADDERTFKREQMKADARAKNAELRAKQARDLLTQRYGLMATKDLAARTEAKWRAMRAVDPTTTRDEAELAASQEIDAEYGLKTDLLKSRIAYNKEAVDALKKRVFYEGQRIDIALDNADREWATLGLADKKYLLDEAWRQALLGLKGQDQQQEMLKLQATPLMQQLQQLEVERRQLEMGQLDMSLLGTAGGLNAQQKYEKVDGSIDAIKDRLFDLIRKYPAKGPKMDPRTPQPSPRRGNGAAQQSSGAKDPQVQAYADKFFNGRYEDAVRAIQQQRRR